MKTKFLSYFIVLITTTIFSQEVNFDIGTINEKKYFEEINFELVYDKIVLPVVINGKKYQFLLDTGAPNVISKKVFDDLNLEKTKTLNVNDANNLNQTMQAVQIPKLEIGSLRFENQAALIYDLENHNLLGCFKIDGFIGSNLLRNSVIKISLSEKKITLSDNIKNINPKVKPSKIKLFGSQKAPFIEFDFVGTNKEKGTDMVLIDTGMDGYYEMSNRAFTIFEEHKIFEILGKSEGINSVGLFGTTKPTLQHLFTVEKGILNNATIKNLVINTTDDTNSRIGIDFLNYSDLILDFKNKQAYFETNGAITLENTIPKYVPTVLDNKFIIGLVWDENLAKEMHFGDEIISMDAQKISELNFCDILSLKREGQKKLSYTLEIKTKENKIKTLKIEKQ
ncbi:retropepsin-like aspartic protease [Flavobacterium sp.]|uniref:retropepsin-like aspartic protease n=1 Tax=Flavobacterium sp. TaxID=239 RepID=UPI002488A977|nr:retropepsin-like aspartic protease [Flavobacterium sp.]MDI1318082.1 retropepsin-like aspartic protease [Flavobacterium sp.]